MARLPIAQKPSTNSCWSSSGQAGSQRRVVRDCDTANLTPRPLCSTPWRATSSASQTSLVKPKADGGNRTHNPRFTKAFQGLFAGIQSRLFLSKTSTKQAVFRSKAVCRCLLKSSRQGGVKVELLIARTGWGTLRRAGQRQAMEQGTAAKAVQRTGRRVGIASFNPGATSLPLPASSVPAGGMPRHPPCTSSAPRWRWPTAAALASRKPAPRTVSRSCLVFAPA